MYKFPLIITLITVITFFNACVENPKEKEVEEAAIKIPEKTEIEANKVSVSYFNLAKAIFENPSDAELQQNKKIWKQELGSFYFRYTNNIIAIGSDNDPGFFNNFSLFANDGDMIKIYGDVSKKFADFNPYLEQLNDAFSKYKVYFPDRNIPKIVAYTGAFSYTVAATDSVLGIGLDMYLGENYPYYAMKGIPKYKSKIMKSEFLVANTMKGWISSEFWQDLASANLLETIIHEGKLLYIAKMVLPETPDSILLGYSSHNMQWARLNESNLWKYFVDNKLLYDSRTKVIAEFTGEGPFTTGLSNNSAPKAGIFTGFQIVKAWMKNQKDFDPQKLIETDAKTILAESRYKPVK